MQQPIQTPAFVTDHRVLDNDLMALRQIADQASCKLLYSPKACALGSVLARVAGHVDGFACSSVNELKMVDQLPGEAGSRHLVSPLVTEQILDEIGDRLDYVTFNSMSQWDRLGPHVAPSTRAGLRINPQISFVRDSRYDPCTPNSKLGVPIDQLAEVVRTDPARLHGLSGLHFHTNCDETDFASLLATARHIQDVIPDLLQSMDWMNMGGGYLFNETENLQDFYAAAEIFRSGFGLEVLIEPGAAIMRRAGTIEATVQDLIEGDDLQIAILDTTVNHMPEVFEFQFEPDVLGHVDGGRHPYMLAGCTCLAGDLFGEYAFDTPLAIGSKVTFVNMGAYTTTKWHRFNGVPLPTIYDRHGDGTIELVHSDSFENFARDLGVSKRAIA